MDSIFATWSLMLVLGFILFLKTTSTYAASFGEVCLLNSDCTDANTECVKFRECATGTCQCVSGYGNSNSTGCQKHLRSYGQSCGSDSFCSGANQECSGGQCSCTMWNTYNALEQGCVTDTYMVLTEVCGGWWNLQCIVQDAVGGSCGSSLSTCTCKDGYQMDLTESYITCRVPRYGESCRHSPACDISYNSSTVSDDLSSHTPTCNQEICECPVSHEHKVVLGHDLCLSSVAEGTVLKEDGETCTHFNECESSLCVKCVNTTSGVCMDNAQVVDGTIPDSGVDCMILEAKIPIVMAALVFVFSINYRY